MSFDQNLNSGEGLAKSTIPWQNERVFGANSESQEEELPAKRFKKMEGRV